MQRVRTVGDLKMLQMPTGMVLLARLPIKTMEKAQTYMRTVHDERRRAQNEEERTSTAEKTFDLRVVIKFIHSSSKISCNQFSR